MHLHNASLSYQFGTLQTKNQWESHTSGFFFYQADESEQTEREPTDRKYNKVIHRQKKTKCSSNAQYIQKENNLHNNCKTFKRSILLDPK